jgi:stress-induced morphogen
MAFTLGNLFPNQSFNEPILSLDDPKWEKLEGGHKGTSYDVSVALRQLQQATTLQQARLIYKELWDELHHQGDIGLASLYAVPHLVRIAKESELIDWNVLGLITLIEVQRVNTNMALPTELKTDYNIAIQNLSPLATSTMAEVWNLDLASSALAAIAISKGQVKLANAILNLDSEDVIEEFLESY